MGRRRWALVACTAASLAACCYPRPAVTPGHLSPHPILWIAESVHAALADAWDQDTLPINNERALCAGFSEAETLSGRRVWTVTAVHPAGTRSVTPSSVTFACPRSPHVIRVHTHPPQSCEALDGGCTPGGIGAFQCWPSAADEAALKRAHEPFGLVQCDRHAIAVFWNPQLVM